MGVPLRSYGRYYGMAGCGESRWRPMRGVIMGWRNGYRGREGLITGGRGIV